MPPVAFHHIPGGFRTHPWVPQCCGMGLPAHREDLPLNPGGPLSPGGPLTPGCPGSPASPRDPGWAPRTSPGRPLSPGGPTGPGRPVGPGCPSAPGRPAAPLDPRGPTNPERKHGLSPQLQVSVTMGQERYQKEAPNGAVQLGPQLKPRPSLPPQDHRLLPPLPRPAPSPPRSSSGEGL